MATKKEASSSPPKRPGKAVNYRMREELVEALDAYLDSLRPRPTAKAAIELAIEEFLARHGFWPPK